MASAAPSLPQASLDMLVLQAVAAGPMHGFGIMQRLEQLSAEVVRFPRASLYPALHRLEARRLIAGDWRPAQDGRDAKFYQVTGAGRARLAGDAGWGLLSKAVGHLATLEQEMRTASAIQRALLPNTHRAGSFFDAAAAAEPCRAIGGDFFDYIDPADGALGFVLGDVAGKGPPAALLAALMQGSLVAQADAGAGPASTVAAVNAAVARRGSRGASSRSSTVCSARTEASRTATPVTIRPSSRGPTGASPGSTSAGWCWACSMTSRSWKAPRPSGRATTSCCSATASRKR